MSYPVFYVPSGDVLPIMFSTYGKTNGESITLTGLAVTDIEIYKDGGTTQRASDAGYTLLDTDGIDFDAITGIHGFSIDTGDNTDAGFYTVGAWFTVVVSAVTIDSQTVNFVAAQFRLMPAESVAGKPKVDVDAWLGTAAATPTVAGVPEVDVTHFNGTAGTFASGRPEVKLGDVAHGGSSATITAERIIVASTTSNEPAVKFTGNGSGAGVLSTGGATGDGFKLMGGATSGDGIHAEATTEGNGMHFVGRGTDAVGQNIAGGYFQANGGSASSGIYCGGVLGGSGFQAVGGNTGPGITVTGGSVSGVGISITTTSGDGIDIAPTAGHGIDINANGTSKHGVNVVGGTAGTSDGIKASAGSGGVDIRGNITGNLVGTVSTLTTYTGNTPQTGDSYAIVNSGTHGNAAIKGYVDDIGVAGAGLTAVPWNAAWDAEVQSECADALSAYGAATSTNVSAVETDTQDIQSRLPAALTAGGNMKSDALAIDGSTTAATNQKNAALAVYVGSVTGATPSTTTLVDTGLIAADNDNYKGRIIIFTSGANKYQATDVTAFTAGTDTLTFTALTSAPAQNDTYVLV